jgi:hypothetical protein
MRGALQVLVLPRGRPQGLDQRVQTHLLPPEGGMVQAQTQPPRVPSGCKQSLSDQGGEQGVSWTAVQYSRAHTGLSLADHTVNPRIPTRAAKRRAFFIEDFLHGEWVAVRVSELASKETVLKIGEDLNNVNISGVIFSF